MKTPVLFLVFNRPELTFQVFEEIRKAKPAQLYIAADGPREDKDGEAEKCELTRSIINKIDWNCEVKTLFRDKNLGCKIAVSSAITWFFDNVEEGIILEDDCLPDPSFFKFCEELLERYRDNETIMHIGGTNFQDGIERGKFSYYFSNLSHIWGWATWRRAWKKYTIGMDGFEEFLSKDKLKKKLGNKIFADFFNKKLGQTFEGTINTWDYQWSFTIWKNDGLCIIPNKNLVSNIGFGNNATHTVENNSELSVIRTEEIHSIIHPETIKINKKADNYFIKKHIGYNGIFDYYYKYSKKKSTNIIYPVYKKIFKN